MNSKSLALLSILLLSSGTVLAAQDIEPVQVRASQPFSLAFSCANPSAPSPADVERLLSINDTSQTHQLTSRLMTAVDKACSAGLVSIVVQRSAAGHELRWHAGDGTAASVALN